MKQLGTGKFAVLLALCCGMAALAAPSPASARRAPQVVAAPALPPPDFGEPPSGAVPIIYNDHHVYTKPDVLRRERVLAALAYDGTILVPLRSLFEQMGGRVSYDELSQTVTVSKPGQSIRLTVGRPWVVINGEVRPLDVPPMMYGNVVLVPVRVISEVMGAYVQWLPDRHLVVIRYGMVRPRPHPRPWMAPTPTPMPPAVKYRDAYIAGDYIVSPRVYNEFSPGNIGVSSYEVHGALEFTTWNIPWMVEGNFVNWQYPHFCNGPTDAQCYVTPIGGTTGVYVPGREEVDSDADVRLGLRILNPRIYIGVGYLWRSNNYGYPNETGFGFGAEKLPDLDQRLSVYGNIWYYPSTQGQYVDAFGTPYNLAYRVLKYQIGGTWIIGPGPLFLDFGWIGDDGRANNVNDPASYTHDGPYIGIGIKF